MIFLQENGEWIFSLLGITLVPLAGVFYARHRANKAGEHAEAAKEQTAAAAAAQASQDEKDLLEAIALNPSLITPASAEEPYALKVTRGDTKDLKMIHLAVWLVLEESVVSLPLDSRELTKDSLVTTPRPGLGEALSRVVKERVDAGAQVLLVASGHDASASAGKRRAFYKSQSLTWNRELGEVVGGAERPAHGEVPSASAAPTFAQARQALALDVALEAQPLQEWSAARPVPTPAPKVEPIAMTADEEAALLEAVAGPTHPSFEQLAGTLSRTVETIHGQVRSGIESGKLRTLRGSTVTVGLDDASEHWALIEQSLQKGARTYGWLRQSTGLSADDMARAITEMEHHDRLLRLPNGQFQLAAQAVDRDWWVEQSSEEMVALAEKVFRLAVEIDPTAQLQYSKPSYLAVVRPRAVKPLVLLYPRKRWTTVRPRFAEGVVSTDVIASAGLEPTGRVQDDGSVGIRLTPAELTAVEPKLRVVLGRCLATTESEGSAP